MTIDLDRETQHLIEQEIRTGRFQDASALVSAAVRHLLVTRETLGYSREQIDAMIAESIGSLERGEGVDGERFFAELEQEEAKRQRE